MRALFDMDSIKIRKREAAKRFYYRNREKIIEERRAYRALPGFKEKSRKWREQYLSRPEIIIKIKAYRASEEYRKSRTETRKKYALDLKTKVFDYYSKGVWRCDCCGEDEVGFLTIDHMDNDGNKQRKEFGRQSTSLYLWIIKNNYPKKFKIMCFNCNLGRDKQKDKICPHNLSKQREE